MPEILGYFSELWFQQTTLNDEIKVRYHIFYSKEQTCSMFTTKAVTALHILFQFLTVVHWACKHLARHICVPLVWNWKRSEALTHNIMIFDLTLLQKRLSFVLIVLCILSATMNQSIPSPFTLLNNSVIHICSKEVGT